MAKVILICPKCKRKFPVEISVYAIEPKTRQTIQPLRCPYCGTFARMKKK